MIFIIADIHAEKRIFDKRITDIEKRFGRRPDERDLIVCAGDLLGNYKKRLRGRNISMSFSDKRFLKWLSFQPYQVVSIFGNHDTSVRLYHQIGYVREEMYGNEVLRVADNVCYLKNGEIYDLVDPCGRNEVSILALGGGFGHTWRFHPSAEKARKVWKEYEHLWINRKNDCGDYSLIRRNYITQRQYEDAFNMREGYIEGFYSDSQLPLLSSFENKKNDMDNMNNVRGDFAFYVADNPIIVDYIISHDAPTSKMGWMQRLFYKTNPINEVMQMIYGVVDFKHWYFGHHHMDYNPADGFTCLYNKTACIGAYEFEKEENMRQTCNI